jgi:predicted RNA binding protein YcfA (HicA-like mRNA interferase family)
VVDTDVTTVTSHADGHRAFRGQEHGKTGGNPVTPSCHDDNSQRPRRKPMAYGFNDKDIEKLAKAALHAGWRVEMTKGNHVMWYAPDGETKILSSLTGSPCSWRSFKHQLRKAGLTADKHHKKKQDRAAA